MKKNKVNISRAEKSRRYRENNKLQGKCYSCPRAATMGIYCSEHYLKYRKKVEEWRKKKKCLDCGGDIEGRREKLRCEKCLKKRRDNKDIFKANGICPRCMKNKLKKGFFSCKKCINAKKSKRKKLRENKICVQCEKRQVKDKSSYCSYCLLEFRKRRKNFKRDKLCAKCGGKPIDEKLLCESCYLKETSYRHLGSSKYFSQLKDIWEKQNRLCPYTNIPLALGKNTDLDHIIPKSKGGDRGINNVQWTHNIVNRMKWNSTEEEFLDFVTKIYKHKVLKCQI